MVDNEGGVVVEPDATYTPRDILPRALSAKSLDELIEAGVGLRTRRSDDDPAEPDDAYATVCRIADNGEVSFGADAADPRRGTRVIELGPLAVPVDGLGETPGG